MRREVLRSRIAWGILLLGLCALYFFENNEATRSLLTAAIALPLVSWLFFRRGVKRAGVSLTVEQASRPEILLTAGAKGLSPLVHAVCRLESENLFTRVRAERLVPLRPGKSEPLELPANACGLYEIRSALQLQDALGLFFAEVPGDAPQRAMILPELFLPRIIFREEMDSGEGETYSRERPGQDPGEFFGVREYVPGDPIRQIHWKLSEKTDKAMVREFGLPVSHRTVLAFSGQGAAGSEETLDAMARVFFSVSRSLAASEEPHLLLWQPEEGGAVSFAVHTSRDEEQAKTLFFSGPLDLRNALQAPQETALAAHALLVAGAYPSASQAAGFGRRLTVCSPAEEKPAGAGYTAVPLNARDPQSISALEL